MTGTFVTKDFDLPQVVLFADSALKFSRPLSVYLLASHLRTHGVSCQPVWAWRHVEPAEFYNLCKKFLSVETKVVGISSTLLDAQTDWFWGIPDNVVEVRFKLIKKLAPNAKIVVGGSQVVEVPPSKIPLKNFVDFFVTGQGENSLLEIVKNSNIRTMQIDPPVITQEQYPYNDFINSITSFTDDDCIVPGEALGYEFARGCIFKCSFCTYDLTGKNRNDFNKSAKTIETELRRNYDQYGTTHYNIVDDLLNDSEEKVNTIAEVADRLPFRLTYSAFVRLDMLRRFPGMVTKLAQSGLVGAFMGIETINDASGRAVGKGLGRQRINEALSIIQEGWQDKVVTEGGFILGLPHDTPDTKYELLEWLQEPLTKSALKYPTITSLSIKHYRKISDIDKNPEKFGYGFDQEHQWILPNYSDRQAREDVTWIRKAYYADRKLNVYPRVDVFTLPYLLSITDCRDEIFNVVMHDQSSIWKSDKEWANWTTQQFLNHRKNYLTKLLNNRT